MRPLALVLSAALAAGPAAAQTDLRLNVAFGEASSAAKDARSELFARSWVSLEGGPDRSCAGALRGVKPLFVLAEDKALAEAVAGRAQARGLQVGEECRGLVVAAARPSLLSQAIAKAETLEAYSRDGELRSAEFPASVGRRRDPVYMASLAFVAGGDAFDLWTTFGAIDRGGYEANPLMAGLGDRNKAGIATLNIGLQTGLVLFNHYFLYKRGHKKIATVLNFATGAVHVGAGVHNLGVGR